MLEEESVHLRRIIENQLSLGYGAHILNLGSSTAYFRSFVQPFINNNIFSILSERKARIFHLDSKKGDGVDLVCDIFEAKRITNRFDLVFCTNVLEHVDDPGMIISTISELLKPGGFVILTVPHIFVYHEDPIDTMYRPNNLDLQGLLPSSFRIVHSSMILIKNKYLKMRIKRMLLIIKSLIYHKPFCNDLRHIVKKFEVSCVVAQKEG